MQNHELSRRQLLGAAAAGAAALSLRGSLSQAGGAPSKGVIAISSGNGLTAIKKAYELASSGVDPLDAAIAGVNLVEDDPEDITVGLGGLPNEEGVVELDAAVMHGPSYRGGAVASLRNIKNPSKVARIVMERSDHVLIVGEGALKFAKAHGFQEENLLTDNAREAW